MRKIIYIFTAFFLLTGCFTQQDTTYKDPRPQQPQERNPPPIPLSILAHEAGSSIGDFDLGSQNQGEIAVRVIEITNDSNKDITLPITITSTNLQTTSTSCSSGVLAQGASCSITLSFLSNTLGPQTIPITFEAVNESFSKTINFFIDILDPILETTLTITGTGGLILDGEDNIICQNIQGSCTLTFDSGEEIVLKAKNINNKIFQRYNGQNCSEENICKITMDSDKSISIEYSEYNYDLAEPLVLGFGDGIWKTNQSQIYGDENYLLYFQEVLTKGGENQIGSELWIYYKNRDKNQVVSSNIYDYLCSNPNKPNPCVIGDYTLGVDSSYDLISDGILPHQQIHWNHQIINFITYKNGLLIFKGIDNQLHAFDPSQEINIPTDLTSPNCPNFNPCVVSSSVIISNIFENNEGVFFAEASNRNRILKVSQNKSAELAGEVQAPFSGFARMYGVENSSEALLELRASISTALSTLYYYDTSKPISGSLQPCTGVFENPCLITTETHYNNWLFLGPKILKTNGKIVIPNTAFSGSGDEKSFIVFDTNLDVGTEVFPASGGNPAETNPWFYGYDIEVIEQQNGNVSKTSLNNEFGLLSIRDDRVFGSSFFGAFELDLTKRYGFGDSENPKILSFDSNFYQSSNVATLTLQNGQAFDKSVVLNEDFLYFYGPYPTLDSVESNTSIKLFRYDLTQTRNIPHGINEQNETCSNPSNIRNPCIIDSIKRPSNPDFNSLISFTGNTSNDFPVLQPMVVHDGDIFFSYNDFRNNLYSGTSQQPSNNPLYSIHSPNPGPNNWAGHEIWTISGDSLSSKNILRGDRLVKFCNGDSANPQAPFVYYTTCTEAQQIYPNITLGNGGNLNSGGYSGSSGSGSGSGNSGSGSGSGSNSGSGSGSGYSGGDGYGGSPDPYTTGVGGPIDEDESYMSFIDFYNNFAGSYDYRNLQIGQTYFEARPISTFPVKLKSINGQLIFFGNNENKRNSRIKTLWIYKDNL